MPMNTKAFMKIKMSMTQTDLVIKGNINLLDGDIDNHREFVIANTQRKPIILCNMEGVYTFWLSNFDNSGQEVGTISCVKGSYYHENEGLLVTYPGHHDLSKSPEVIAPGESIPFHAWQGHPILQVQRCHINGLDFIKDRTISRLRAEVTELKNSAQKVVEKNLA